MRRCREEDEEKSSEEDPESREYEDEIRRTDEFRDECRRKWKEQGKTEAECRKMWPQAFADWRTERKAPDFDTMWKRKLDLIKASAEQPVPMQM